MSPDKLNDQLSYLIANVNKQLEDELQQRLRPAGVPVEQLRVLKALQGSEGRTMGELAALALVEPTTLTKIIDRMVTDGHVVRTPDTEDRRRVRIMPTATGRALLRRLDRIAASQEVRIARSVPSDKLDELRSLLRGLIES